MADMGRIQLLLVCLLTGCRDTPPEPNAAPSSRPVATTAPSVSATTTAAPAATVSAEAHAALERKLLGRWKGTYEAEFRKGGRYVIHGGAKEIIGEWKINEVTSDDTVEVEVVLRGLNSKDLITIRFLDDDRIEWLQKRHRGGAKPVEFNRVAPVTP